AGVMLSDKSQIRLAAGSMLYLKKSGSAPGEEVDKPGAVDLFSGKLWFRNKRKGSKPVFGTPVVSASIRGTEMALSVGEDGYSEVTVLEGQVLCSNLQGEAIIKRGEAVTANKGEAPVITKLLKPENSVQWLLLTPDIIGPADKNKEILSNIDKNGIEIAQKAMELFVQGENLALETAQKAVNIAPSRAATHVALATILQSKGKFQEALKEAKKAHAFDPQSVPALIRTVELLLGLDKIKSAEQLIASFKSAPDKIDDDTKIKMLKGYIALINLDSTKAEKFFKEAIEQKRDFASAYLGLGLALYHQKRVAEGLENMEKASLLEPLAAYPHNYLAKAQYELGERYEAEIELKRAATLDPYDPTPYMYLATILADNYRPGEGIKSLERSITLNDNKLMSRSRYLLDQDRASKNISLAWSLTTMGLYEWADAKGDQAVWDDESNSSAYLFRASKAQIMGQLDADTIGDMKRAELLKPVNANTYTSYNNYQNLLETPKMQGDITLNIGTDKTCNGAINLNGGDTTTAFTASTNYSTTDGPIDNSGKSSLEGKVTVKKALSLGHEIIASANTYKRDMEDISPWQDSTIEPSNIEQEADRIYGSMGYHWHQGAGVDTMALLQYQNYDGDEISITEKYLSSLSRTQYEKETWRGEGKTLRGEVVQLFKFSNDTVGLHSLSAGVAGSKNSSSWDLESALYYEPPLITREPSISNSDDPDKKEGRIFIRDIWSLSDSLRVDAGLAWSNLENIFLKFDNQKSEKEFEDKDYWLPHLGFMWQMSQSDTIRAGYFKESEPQYLSGTLQPVEMAGFSRVFGSLQGTQTEFYGIGWDRQWSSQLFTRAEVYHKNRQFPALFTSHAGNVGTVEERLNRLWSEESQDVGKLTVEYLITDQLGMAITYQFRDHNTESGIDRNRIDNDFGATFTWVHPSGFRLQNSWWYMNQKEKSGYLNPVQDDFIIASISAEKSLFDKRLLLVAKWENIFNEKYSYLISDTTESSQLPWQGSYGVVGLQWNF
ncbi:MAG: FecR domain-containing protein, partial [Desulfamplus sp.]|nr:FecR domain-containing protein [Desulfamplus sp.]